MRISPTYLALLICLSGVVLMPFTPFATDVIDWGLLSGAYIFSDGFETGDTSRWTVTKSGSSFKINLPHGSPFASDILTSADGYGHCLIPREALAETIAPETLEEESVLVFGCEFLLRQNSLDVTFSLEPIPEP